MLHLLALLAGCSVVWGNFSQLEQVMRALEEQGRLSEVSPDLLVSPATTLTTFACSQ